MNSPKSESPTASEAEEEDELQEKNKTGQRSDMEFHEDKKKWRCKNRNCHKSFTRLYQYKKHSRAHEAGKITPYDCPICNERFFKREIVLEHCMEVHGDANPYKCEYCGKCFKRVEYLRSHALMHTGEYPWKCGVCSKGFEFKNVLDKHVALHKKERPFICDECGKDFNYRSAMINHLRIHRGEYGHVCSHCGRGFRNSIHYKEHMDRHEGKYVRFPCEFCGKIYSTKAYLNVHTRTRHDSNAGRVGSRNYVRVAKVEDIDNYEHVQVVENQMVRENRNWGSSFGGDGENDMETYKKIETELERMNPEEKIFSEAAGNFSRELSETSRDDDEDDIEQEGESDDDFLDAVSDVELGEESFIKLKSSISEMRRSRSDDLKAIEPTGLFKNSLECSYCGKICSTSAYLKVHLRIHTKEYPITCAVCSKGFDCKGHLIRHLLIHTKERPFVCKICGKDFNVKSVLKNHMKQHTGRYEYQCEYCGRNFHNSRHFKDHVAERHLGRVHRNFVCEHCGQSYRRKLFLQRHLDRHAGVGKTFECSKCGGKFSFYSDFRSHKKTHNKCGICDKTFSKLATYKKHVKMNSCQKELICEFCHRRFDNGGNFKKHMKTHEYGRTNKQPYNSCACNMCGKSFSRRNTLERHIDRAHGDFVNGKYECDICRKTFVSAASLKGHSKTHFARELHCQYCSRVFNHVGNYNKHVKMHESPNSASKKINFFTCVVCNTSFSRKFTLTNHYERVHKFSNGVN